MSTPQVTSKILIGGIASLWKRNDVPRLYNALPFLKPFIDWFSSDSLAGVVFHALDLEPCGFSSLFSWMGGMKIYVMLLDVLYRDEDTLFLNPSIKGSSAAIQQSNQKGVPHTLFACDLSPLYSYCFFHWQWRTSAPSSLCHFLMPSGCLYWPQLSVLRWTPH